MREEKSNRECDRKLRGGGETGGGRQTREKVRQKIKETSERQRNDGERKEEKKDGAAARQRRSDGARNIGACLKSQGRIWICHVAKI